MAAASATQKEETPCQKERCMVKGFNKDLGFPNRELWRLGRLANSPWSNRWVWHGVSEYSN